LKWKEKKSKKEINDSGSCLQTGSQCYRLLMKRKKRKENKEKELRKQRISPWILRINDGSNVNVDLLCCPSFWKIK